ncbi:hypothetical protein ACJ41O_011710 [Fusarium nematophilum]
MRLPLAIVAATLAGSLDLVAASRCKPSSALSSVSVSATTTSTKASASDSKTSTNSAAPGASSLSVTLSEALSDVSATSSGNSAADTSSTGTTINVSSTSGTAADLSATLSGTSSDISATRTSTVSVTSSTATSTSLPIVPNLIGNGNNAIRAQNPNDIYAFTPQNQAKTHEGGCYTDDNAQEDRCIGLISDTTAGPFKRQAQASLASVKQRVKVPSPKVVFRLFYKVILNDLADACKVKVTYGEQPLASSPGLTTLDRWIALTASTTLAVLDADLKIELSCENGRFGTAHILIDQIFMSGAVGLADLNKIQIDWDAKPVPPVETSTTEGITTTSAESTTATSSETSETATQTASTESSITGTSSATEYIPTSSWTLTVSGTAIPTSSATASIPWRPEPTSIDDLSPNAKELFDFLIGFMNPDADGNVNVPAPKQDEDEKELVPTEFNPDDDSRQQDLADELEEMGLSPLDDLLKEADQKNEDFDNAVCPSPQKRRTLPVASRGIRSISPDSSRSKRSSRFTRAARRLDNYLSKREDKDGWDYACDDLVGEFLGLFDVVGDVHEAVCTGKDIYDNRDAFKCIFGGCGYTIKYEEWTYTWEYEWRVTFPSISQWLRKIGESNVLSCVDCSMKLSSLRFTGKIIVWLIQGRVEIKSANLVPEVTGNANMIVDLRTNMPWTSEWKWVFDAAPLDTITYQNAYSIKSKVLYEVGIKFVADKAVNVKAGASFNINNARAELDISNGNGPTIRSKDRWEPSVSYTYPAFTTTGGVKLQPYVRWGVEFDIDIYNQVKLAPAFSSESVVTIKSTFSDQAQGQCQANKLAVNTYMTTRSIMRLRPGVFDTLYSGDSRNVNQCFDVPELIPSPDEIRSLASVGGDFCTSYIGYKAPRTTVYETSTTYTPSSTITNTITSMAPRTTTVWVTHSEFETLQETLFGANPATVTGDGTAVFNHQDLKRQVTEPAGLVARQAIQTPALVSDWDRTKISFACKQVATGTATVTQTVPTTIPSGVATTSTVTYKAVDGPIQTLTAWEWWAVYDGVYEWQEGPRATACAKPEPKTGKCFKVKIHGPQWVDGQYLKYSPDQKDSLMAGRGMPFLNLDTFYLSDSGRLITQDPRSLTGAQFAVVKDGVVEGAYSNDPTPAGTEPLYCRKEEDPCSDKLYCSTATRDGIRFREPRYVQFWRRFEELLNIAEGYRAFRMNVGEVEDSELATLTYEPVSCVCSGSRWWE